MKSSTIKKNKINAFVFTALSLAISQAVMSAPGNIRSPEVLPIEALSTTPLCLGTATESGSDASVAFNTSSLTASSFVYLSQFTTNQWTGDLYSFALDPITGVVASSTTWQAGSVLTNMSNPSPFTNRNIFTYNGDTGQKQGVSFNWSYIPTALKNDLQTSTSGVVDTSAAGIAAGQSRLNYLRGDRSNEVVHSGPYRTRLSLLGDIIESSPVFIGAPTLNYPSVSPFPINTSDGAYHTYGDFKAGTIGVGRTRNKIIYAGANDGMLHGFNATDGSEAMAYLPSYLANSSAANTGFHYLTDPAYTHQYYVDMPPAVSDVYINKNDGLGLHWETVLIGGSHGGGKGIFALDITDPSLFTESVANAKKLALWEFTSSDDANMGYSFSEPTIAMMNNGRWAAIFGNGYANSGDHTARLFIVFLDGGLDGVWTAGTDYISIATSDATVNNGVNNGLSTPRAVDIGSDGIPDRVYAGDLAGNLWSFNISSTSTTSWGVTYSSGGKPAPLFTAVDSLGNIQPITQKPIVVQQAADIGTNKVMVFFGTGKFLDSGDSLSTTNNSFYGIYDKGSTATRSNLIQQTFLSGTFTDSSGNTVTSGTRVLTDNSVNYTTKSGWYIDLPVAGERVIVDASVRGGLVYFNTWVPNSTIMSCSNGGVGFLMSVQQINGGNPLKAAFSLGGGSTVGASDMVTRTVSGVTTSYAVSGQQFSGGLPSASGFLGDRQYTSGTIDGSTVSTRSIEHISTSSIGRYSWRELR